MFLVWTALSTQKKPKTSFWNLTWWIAIQVLFLYLNFYTFSTFTNNVGHILVTVKIFFLIIFDICILFSNEPDDNTPGLQYPLVNYLDFYIFEKKQISALTLNLQKFLLITRTFFSLK